MTETNKRTDYMTLGCIRNSTPPNKKTAKRKEFALSARTHTRTYVLSSPRKNKFLATLGYISKEDKKIMLSLVKLLNLNSSPVTEKPN